MTTSSGVVKLGIIGCGRVAWERHLPALRHVPGIRVVAVADSDAERVASVAEQHRIPQRYTDYRELLGDPRIDAVGILTPTGSHMEIGLAAMEAGKHIFLEKPLALTIEECDRLILKDKTSQGCILVCFNLRWHRLIQEARKLIQKGSIGNLRAIRSCYTHFRDGSDAPPWHRFTSQGGGVTFNESVHHFDLWVYLTDQTPEEISSFSCSSSVYEDETSVTNARLSGGALASCVNTFGTSPNNELELLGDKARLLINLYQFDGLHLYPSHIYPGNIPDRIKKTLTASGHFAKALMLNGQGGDFGATFVNIWKHFADCTTGRANPLCTLEDGRQAVRVALAAQTSFLYHKSPDNG